MCSELVASHILIFDTHRLGIFKKNTILVWDLISNSAVPEKGKHRLVLLKSILNVSKKNRKLIIITKNN